jgi:hypothetical protein
VRIIETRPISKEKRWRIAETLVRGNVAEIAPREIGVPEEGLYRPERPEPAPSAAVDSAEAEVAPAAEAEAEAAPAAEAEAEAAPAAEVEAEAAPAAEVEAEAAPAEAEDATEGGDKE